jgi:hypothetical protein
MGRRRFLRRALGAAGSLAVPSSALADREPPLRREPVARERLVATLALHYMTWLEQRSWSFASTWPVLRNPAYALPRGYDSSDPYIFRHHNALAARHGFAWLWSWWGRGAIPGGDWLLKRYLEDDPGAEVPLVLLYEATGILAADRGGFFGFDDPRNAEQFVDDVAYLDREYWRNPRHAHRFLRVDDRPVLFPWVSRNFIGAWPEAVARAREVAPFYLVGSEIVLDLEADGVTPRVREDLAAVLAPLDAVSSYGTYDPRYVPKSGRLDVDYATRVGAALRGWAELLSARAPGRRLIPPLQFAFDDRYIRPGSGNPPLDASGAEALDAAMRVRSLVDGAAAGDPHLASVLPLVFLVSWNEHLEGSAIEWTDEHGYTYLLAALGAFRR